MKPKNLVAQARLDSPLGPITVAATAKGLAGLCIGGGMGAAGVFEVL